MSIAMHRRGVIAASRHLGSMTPPELDYDPHWDAVESLVRMEGVPGDLTTLVDIKGHSVTHSSSGVDFSTTTFKFGTSSLHLTSPSASWVQSKFAAPIGTSEYTLEGWFYLPGSVDSSGGHTLFGLNYPNIYFQIVNGIGSYTKSGSSPVTGDASVTFPKDEWTHVAITFTAGTHHLWIGGKLSLSVARTETTSSSAYYSIGSTVTVTLPRSFLGFIDSCRFTRDVVRYAANFTPPSKDFPLSGPPA